jgi:hypothetical protein
MQPLSGGDVSNRNYYEPDSPPTASTTSFPPTPLEHFHPTDCGSASLFLHHQGYTKAVVPESGTFGICISTVHSPCVTDLGPTHCIPFAGNMNQYNTVTHLPEQPVGRTQQSFPTLIYNHHHPVSPQPSSYQGHIQNLQGSYETDSTTTVPSQLITSSSSVFYGQVDQNQGTPTTAVVPANQCPESPQVLGLPPSPVLSLNQALGLTPYRQSDSGPRRILAVPIQSLSITDPTICAIVAAFQIASWMQHQVEEPGQAGRSCYFQLIDESSMTCRLCGKHERRAERLVSHLRGHFDHRPYPCGGQCGIMEW